MRVTFRCVFVFIIALPLFAAAPSTIHNDDSCDIAALPAATLLLPWFEVDMTSPQGATTIFTVTNVTNLPQIARVTLWTDWSYPVFNFDLFLTGYDVQAISLRDVIAEGQIAPPFGTAADWDDEGARSLDNDDNPLLDVSRCADPVVSIPPALLADLRSALTTGFSGGCARQRVGRTHEGRAIGYATIDVVKSCSAVMPSDPGYFDSEILYDNVLIGDYQHVDRRNNFAQGGTMVHIRAIPEGGTAADVPTFASTFYSRHQSGGTADRRQPLPALFAMRWIDAGLGALNTTFKIWRDRAVDADGCDVSSNERHASADVVRFDEDENPTVHVSTCLFACWPYYVRPSTSSAPLSDTSLFPPSSGGDPGGWLYINLNDYEARPVASQSWVTVAMSAEGRYTTEVDATALGNGCSPEGPHWTDRDGGSPVINPAPDDNGAKTPGFLATIDNDDSCDITQAPAATLLLPYFEVDLDGFDSVENTLFTVTNVSPLPQIAHVTIWTDRAYPILTFDIFLTGYDVQSVSLFDVLAHGCFAWPVHARELEPGRRSADNGANPIVDATTCAALPAGISAPVLAEVQRALTTGLIQACGNQRIGETHADAIGYVTIDVVRDCSTTLPTDPRYYSDHISYDNVLTGDYLQIDPANNFAQGGAMVHIRAIPEGGRGNDATTFARTFYSRYQSGRTGDRRQPLPSTFAARWIAGGAASFNTTLKVWRETATGSTTGCAVKPREYEYANAPEFVRFDEDENPSVYSPDVIITVPPPTQPRLPAASRVSASDREQFPPNPGGDIAGWFYLNLDLGFPVDPPDPDVASQNWVIVSMRAEGRFSVDFDAPALGNGCSPVAPMTAEDGSDPVIGPAENRNPIWTAPFDTIAPEAYPLFRWIDLGPLATSLKKAK